jgi:peptide/nickel transport system substrate-binding protein
MTSPGAPPPTTHMHARTPFLVAALASLAALAGCGGDDAGPNATGETGGTVIIATGAEPSTLFPPLAVGTQSAAVIAQLFDRLAEIGDSLNTVGDAGFRPRLAKSWLWADDSLSISFALDPRARWHDGRPVRAADVKYSFDVYTDPATGSPTASLLATIDSVSVADSLTAVFWFKRRTPQQFFDATYQMWVLPSHVLRNVPPARLAAAPFARQPIGTGRFRFASWTPRQQVEIVADAENYRGRALLDRVVWQIAPDFGAATISLINGQADFFEVMRPEYIGQLARNQALHLVPYPSLDYGFLQFNLRASDGSGRPHAVFADRSVRHALTMAIDRERVVRSAYDSLAYVAVGPVPRALFPDWAKIQQIPFKPQAARTLLDSAGWRDGDGDGVRERGGARLAFSIIFPSSSASRQRIAVLLQEQLRAVGVDASLDAIEVNAFNERQAARRFDASMGGWHVDPSQAVALQTWGAIGAQPNGSNFGSYVNPEFDARVDSALTTLDPARSRALWLRAYQTIVDDAPAVWLFEPRLVAGSHRRVRLAHLRADGWWAGLADWSIPLRDRIGRDRIGLR